MVMTAREGWPATEEDVMHPVIAQAIATERSSQLRANAAAAARARQQPWAVFHGGTR
jgi:hypothetical protein